MLWITLPKCVTSIPSAACAPATFVAELSAHTTSGSHPGVVIGAQRCAPQSTSGAVFERGSK